MLALPIGARYHIMAGKTLMRAPIGWISAQDFLREASEIVGRRHDAARFGRDMHHRSFRQVDGIMMGSPGSS